MANINLLPWRDELRQERQKEFFIFLGLSVGFACVAMFAVHTVFQNKIDDQNSRNRLLTTEISRLDKQIDEITELEKQKEELINRMDIIQDLQQSRPLIVRLFDELVRLVPDGVSLNTLERRNQDLLLEGRAESNPRVSTFMRKIESSEWITEPVLKVIRTDEKSSKSLSDFKMTAKIVKNKDKEGK